MLWKVLFWLYRIFFLLWGSLGVFVAGFLTLQAPGAFGRGKVVAGAYYTILFATVGFGLALLYCGISFRELLFKRFWVLLLFPTLFLGVFVMLNLALALWGAAGTLLFLELLFLGGLYYLRVRRPQEGW